MLFARMSSRRRRRRISGLLLLLGEMDIFGVISFEGVLVEILPELTLTHFPQKPCLSQALSHQGCRSFGIKQYYGDFILFISRTITSSARPTTGITE
jgi:hypothetical protein